MPTFNDTTRRIMDEDRIAALEARVAALETAGDDLAMLLARYIHANEYGQRLDPRAATEPVRFWRAVRDGSPT